MCAMRGESATVKCCSAHGAARAGIVLLPIFANRSATAITRHVCLGRNRRAARRRRIYPSINVGG